MVHIKRCLPPGVGEGIRRISDASILLSLSLSAGGKIECREIHTGASDWLTSARLVVPSSDTACFTGRGGRVWVTNVDESSHSVYKWVPAGQLLPT